MTAKHYGDISKEVLQQAKDRGTAVHAACEDLDIGFDAEDVPAEYEGYVRAYLAFKNDYRPTLLGMEQKIYNAEQGYAGRFDRWFEWDGDEAILDIKTTTSPTKTTIIAGCAQTHAYAIAMKGVKRRFLLYLRKDGKYRLVDCAEYEKKHDFDARRVWELCLALYNETERNVK